MLPSNLEAMARPATYITFQVWTSDGRTHDVIVYFDSAADAIVSSSATLVDWARGHTSDGDAWLRVGAHVQQIFSETGDRPNWGFLYLGIPSGPDSSGSIAPAGISRTTFARTGILPPDGTDMPQHAGPDGPVLAYTHRFSVGAKPQQTTIVAAVDMVCVHVCVCVCVCVCYIEQERERDLSASECV